MFRNNFVVAIKVDGKFVREDGDQIRIPFNSEYSIYFKNLDFRRAVSKVTIDGKDVLDGQRVIIEGNSSITIDGYMNGSIAENKFKFIKMTKAIEDHRGVTPEDGLISVEFDREREKPVYIPSIYIPGYYGDYNPPPYTLTTWGSTSIFNYTTSENIPSVNRVTGGRGSSSGMPVADSVNLDNQGISVPGSNIHQQFMYGYVGELENRPTTIAFKLFGFTLKGDTQPFLVKHKLTCSVCETKNKSFSKFCRECGARLINK